MPVKTPTLLESLEMFPVTGQASVMSCLHFTLDDVKIPKREFLNVLHQGWPTLNRRSATKLVQGSLQNRMGA
jgi:hypothetical protein